MKNKPLILSTAYFPPIDYWVSISQHSKVLIEAHENYQKQSFRNRCQIMGPNGVQNLNIPIAKTGKAKTPIREVQIFDDQLWQKIHWKSIETAYNCSPFFLYYADYFEGLFTQKPKGLFDFNMDIMNSIMDILELDQKLETTDSYIKNYDDAVDLRNVIHPKRESIYTDKLRTNEYIQVFSERHGFAPNLSILDLIFNLGPEARFYIDAI
ncbi:MAG: hypothetical protein DSY76_06170 [Bacteroidetes bacterium]|nr:MAG: hypothetical protein DSY76_06170 [Bacteroidota bacterium]